MQVPAPFEYVRAESVDHALELLDQLGPGARIIAGGHSLLPMMKLRLARPEAVVDINDLFELDYVVETAGQIRIGALTRHRALLESDDLLRRAPIFADAERVIADPVVRNRGTIGGSLCQADPAEDLSTVCAVVDAEVVIRGAGGERVASMAQFYRGPYETAVGAAEMLMEVRVPVRMGAGSAYHKVERRVGDWAVAAAGAQLVVEDGTVADARIGLTALGLDAGTLTRAEAALRGAAVPDVEGLLDELAQIAAADCDPVADQRGPVDYKRHLAGELTRRAVTDALARAVAAQPVGA
jgi:aerobic carbon-monoxide dehydrogenase medium subunit